MLAGAADPAFVADEEVGKLVLAELCEADRGAHVGPRPDRAPFCVAIIVQPLVIGRADAEGGGGEEAVEGLLVGGGAPQVRLDPLRPLAGGLGARRPIMAGGSKVAVGRPPGDRVERLRRLRAAAHAPRSESRDPGRLHRPFPAPGAAFLGDPPRRLVVTDNVPGPGDALAEFGLRLQRDLGLPGTEGDFGLGRPVGDDQRLDLRVQGEGRRIAKHAAHLVPARLAALPDQILRLRQRRQRCRAAAGGEACELVGLGHFRRPRDQRGERLELHLRRTLCEVQLGPQRVAERPVRERVEPCRGACPVAGANSVEDRAIIGALAVREDRGDAQSRRRCHRCDGQSQRRSG